MDGSFHVQGKWVQSDFRGSEPGTLYIRTYTFIPECTVNQGTCDTSLFIYQPDGTQVEVDMNPTDAAGKRWFGRIPKSGTAFCKKGDHPWVTVPDGWKGEAKVSVRVVRTGLVKGILRAIVLRGTVEVDGVIQPKAGPPGCTPGTKLLGLVDFRGDRHPAKGP
jgi:hypothetical protein